MFKIKDWAGNVCFDGKTFPDFESAWGFIYEYYMHLPEPEFADQMSEFEVIPV